MDSWLLSSIRFWKSLCKLILKQHLVETMALVIWTWSSLKRPAFIKIEPLCFQSVVHSSIRVDLLTHGFCFVLLLLAHTRHAAPEELTKSSGLGFLFVNYQSIGILCQYLSSCVSVQWYTSFLSLNCLECLNCTGVHKDLNEPPTFVGDRACDREANLAVKSTMRV